eukprot:GHVU01009477.1.p1 GENE.GHVU01009477.1~~GHVU01009477.1.p1  ORF type:complete len:247 (+),score=17.94 GHVU01009477.1:37-777(+)
MAQSANGRIKLFEDFFTEDNIAHTAASRPLGNFTVSGQGCAEVDSGIPTLNADAISGVGVMTTTDEADHTILIGTPIAFDVGLMGTIVAETRVRFVDLDTKEVFFGFTDVDPEALGLQAAVLTGASTTITLTASDICGFYLSAELTEDEDWHTVYNGGATTGETDSTAIECNDDAVAGEWQVLRLELAPNGTVRWLLDGVLVRTVAGAVSTSVDLSLILALDAKGAAIEIMHVDYLSVEANRDWTA